MNIILAEAHEVEGSRLLLTDHRAKHLVKVLQAAIGDRVRVGVVNGAMGLGTVTAIERKFPFAVALEVVLDRPPAERPFLDLILALPRPIMLKRILSQATALGVGTIHLIHASRVEKSFWEASILRPDEYRQLLVQGLEQAVDTRLPELRLHPRFKPFIEDHWPPQAGEYQRLLLAHPTGDHRLAEVVGKGDGRLVLAVGPEGGWVDYEVEKFRQQGFTCCRFGQRILKVDTAVVALHAAISALREAGHHQAS